MKQPVWHMLGLASVLIVSGCSSNSGISVTVMTVYFATKRWIIRKRQS